MFLYSIVFAVILIIESTVFALHFSVENDEFKIFFTLLLLITGLAFAVFIIEALVQRRQSKKIIEVK
jgi:membrane protein YdbS with pleckstrin-like domain